MGYRSNLNTAAVTLNEARDTVLTQRNFNSFAEDPSSATQAFQLRRSWHRTDAQYTVNQSTYQKFSAAWETLDSVTDMLDTDASNTALEAALRGASDSTAAGRNSLGAELSQLAESVVQTMNDKYGDNFIFAGADGKNVPFTWEGDQLYYRGINVTPAVDEDGNVDQDTLDKLDALAGEANYVDIGLGIQTDDNGDVIPTSAFNDSLTGINYLGYGVDEDGDPKNIACILKRMGTLLSNCDTNGNWAEDGDSEEFERLLGKLQDASSELKSGYVQLDVKAAFLQTNSTKLTNAASDLNEQFLEIEQCDLADAITSFSWAQYCYNAALKVGNSLLSQSLIDYMD
jgi:flagellar hook-associated protein 3 FlgL